MVRTLAACIVFLLICGAGDADRARSVLAEQVERTTRGGKTTESIEKVWMRDGRFRSDAVVQGQKLVTIIRREVSLMVRYSQKTKLGQRYQLEPELAKILTSVGDADLDLKGLGTDRRSLTWVRVEKVSGFTCNVYTTSKLKGYTKATVWISSDERYPGIIRVIRERPGEKVETIARNIKLDVKMPDTLFDVPKGVRITDAAPKRSGK